MHKNNFLVIYDITDDKRRKKVVHGYRVQYSAFECNFTLKSKNSVINELEAVTNTNDSVRVYELPESVYEINKGQIFFPLNQELILM